MTSLRTSLRQARASMVAEFQLQQRMEKIKWEEEILKPELERLEREAVNGSVTHFTIEHEDQNDSPTA